MVAVQCLRQRQQSGWRVGLNHLIGRGEARRKMSTRVGVPEMEGSPKDYRPEAWSDAAVEARFREVSVGRVRSSGARDSFFRVPPVGDVEAFQRCVDEAVDSLSTGQVVALPTDTLYGVAASVYHRVGVEGLYAIKMRERGKPLAVCVADVGDVARYAEVVDLPPQLLQALLPGPVTLVLRKRRAPQFHASGREEYLPLCEPWFNPGEDTVAVRIPRASFIRRVCHDLGGALALTSANLAGGPSTVDTAEFKALWPLCDAIFDAGILGTDVDPSMQRLGSTIVDLTPTKDPSNVIYRILRDGSALEQTVLTLTEHGATRVDV